MSIDLSFGSGSFSSSSDSEVALDEVSFSEMKTVFVLVPMVGGIEFAVVTFAVVVF